jgi:hypothetical protein
VSPAGRPAPPRPEPRRAPHYPAPVDLLAELRDDLGVGAVVEATIEPGHGLTAPHVSLWVRIEDPMPGGRWMRVDGDKSTWLRQLMSRPPRMVGARDVLRPVVWTQDLVAGADLLRIVFRGVPR